MVTISFKDRALDEQIRNSLSRRFCVYDVRVNAWRAEAFRYADIVITARMESSTRPGAKLCHPESASSNPASLVITDAGSLA